MSKRIGNLVIIAAEPDQQCDLCGKIAELRPYGPDGACICFECGQKDKVGTQTRMNMVLFGDTEEEAEEFVAEQNEEDFDNAP